MTVLKKTSILFSLITGLILLGGCTDFTVSIRFDRVDGLKQEAPVIFESKSIGRVTSITYTREADFLVAVDIEQAFTHAVTEDTRFYIGVSPMDPESKAVQMEQTVPGGKPIEAGAVVQGSTQNFMFPAAQAMEKTFSKLLEDFEKFQKSDQFKTMKKRLSDLQTQLESSSKEMQEQIRKDILPKIKQTLKEIIKSLEQEGLQDEAKDLEKEFGRLQDI